MRTALNVGDYVNVGEVRTYYESIGEGEPVVLLHGGMCTLETWAPQIPALAAKYRVIVPERRGHGRTADVSGPITYENMAADTIALMDTLRLGSAHLVGWSDGAFVGLLVAMQRPEIVKKLCYISQPINFEGINPKYAAMATQVSREHLPPHFESAYAAVSPDGPEHYAVVADKMLALWRKDPGFSLERLRVVKAPTLIMIADDDMQSVAQGVAMQNALPSAQLAVVPGTSHALTMEKPDLVNRLLLDFLQRDQPKKLFGTS